MILKKKNNLIHNNRKPDIPSVILIDACFCSLFQKKLKTPNSAPKNAILGKNLPKSAEEVSKCGIS